MCIIDTFIVNNLLIAYMTTIVDMPNSANKHINQPELGSGIYTLYDVSKILHLPQNKVRRWLTEYWDNRIGGKFNTRYSWGEGREKAVNFYSLIEFVMG